MILPVLLGEFSNSVGPCVPEAGRRGPRGLRASAGQCGPTRAPQTRCLLHGQLHEDGLGRGQLSSGCTVLGPEVTRLLLRAPGPSAAHL